MGTDLTVVNAARVSFDKESEWERQHFNPVTLEEDVELRVLSERDEKLIRYLATHKHWTPFSHPQVTVRVKAPIFVARQLFKHKVGLTENEVSRRYVDSEPEFFFPDKWRGRPTDGAKQGSSETEVTRMYIHDCAERWEIEVSEAYGHFLDSALMLYDEMLKADICPEQARMILPQSMYTEWIWTGSLAAFARVYSLRTDPHAQQETQEVVRMIGEIIQPLFPCSWEALVNEG